MQLFSFIPRYFARRKAVADLREQCDEARLGNAETAKILTELRGIRDEVGRIGETVEVQLGRGVHILRGWNRNGLPETRDELGAVEAADFARENAERAREGAERARAAAGIASQMAKWDEAGAPLVSDKDVALGARIRR